MPSRGRPGGRGARREGPGRFTYALEGPGGACGWRRARRESHHSRPGSEWTGPGMPAGGDDPKPIFEKEVTCKRLPLTRGLRLPACEPRAKPPARAPEAAKIDVGHCRGHRRRPGRRRPIRMLHLLTLSGGRLRSQAALASRQAPGQPLASPSAGRGFWGR